MSPPMILKAESNIPLNYTFKIISYVDKKTYRQKLVLFNAFAFVRYPENLYQHNVGLKSLVTGRVILFQLPRRSKLFVYERYVVCNYKLTLLMSQLPTSVMHLFLNTDECDYRLRIKQYVSWKYLNPLATDIIPTVFPVSLNCITNFLLLLWRNFTRALRTY